MGVLAEFLSLSAGMLLWDCPHHKSGYRRSFPVCHVLGVKRATDDPEGFGGMRISCTASVMGAFILGMEALF